MARQGQQMKNVWVCQDSRDKPPFNKTPSISVTGTRNRSYLSATANHGSDQTMYR